MTAQQVVAVDRAPAPRVAPVPAAAHRWSRRVRARVALADAIAVYAAVFVAFRLRFGTGELRGLDTDAWRTSHAVTSLALVAGWLVALWLAGTLSVSAMGAGSQEFVRVVGVTLAVFGAAGVTAYLSRWDLGRAYVAVALPLGLVALGAGRLVMRSVLVAERRAGHHLATTLAVGSRAGVEHLVAEARRLPQAGLDVVGACTDGGGVIAPRATTRDGSTVRVPVVGEVSDAARWAVGHGVEAVVVTGARDLSPTVLRRLAWMLEPHGIRLIVSPGLMDVAAARLRPWPLPGTPLVHLGKPGYTRPHRWLKRVFDIVGSALLIVVFAVPLIVTAVAIKVADTGPVVFRQTRIGVGGRPFQVLKFRSMVVGAEAHQHELAGDDATVYFKSKDDPRVTRVGAFIRRYSIDELPQLFNVLVGSMSLVGPRPLIPHDHDAEAELARRLLVRPGITGLWQVSGRSNLTPEHSVRLDLYYVENWSLAEDLRILLRTARVVVARDGAY